ncbi:TetR/AcrR family transcriptional regulator [Nocardia sp. alder85J]|uniref:TetR/AcrR family transcriptional regulator n=1 Tax=Nocardia sp. alder85J TaxID=2862949 RepID=UPI001CD6C01E|nr:TetR/AcrR family transcriptional regulator [Nocardia sp. alder85J]MCX4098497.1 TetR/AcrR family transcriptional regulator [Nocardia sp. alder85J]
MASRGPYSKGVEKRAEILDTALAVVARNGYGKATVKEIAEAVGLSQNGLLHYFGSKDALFTEILRRRDELDLATYGTPAVDIGARLADLVAHNAGVPGLVELYTRLTAEATESAHPSHPYVRDRYESTRALGRAAFEQLRDTGAIAPGLDPHRLSPLLFAVIDGLQTQWLYDRDIDMPALVRYFLELLATAPAPD